MEKNLVDTCMMCKYYGNIYGFEDEPKECLYSPFEYDLEEDDYIKVYDAACMSQE